MFNSQMKMPKGPDRPLVPYMRYSRKMWTKVRAEHPDAQVWDISKIIGQMWREVPDSEKSIYQQEYEVEKIEYEKAYKAYTNSASFQSYQNQKGSNKAPQKMTRSRADIGGVVIQPVDEDVENNELSGRRLSAIRFDRNHRLVAELLSTNMVNDTRTIVAQSRIELLKKQADSLIMHQKKLEAELAKMDECFNEKKRSLENNSEEFTEKLMKVCNEKVIVEQVKYDEMVDEWKGKLASAYEEYKKKQEEMEKKLVLEREKMAEKTPVLYNLTIGEDDDNKMKGKDIKNKEDEEKKKEVDQKTQEDAKVETEEKKNVDEKMTMEDKKYDEVSKDNDNEDEKMEEDERTK